jgi:hypothetical protein
LESRLQAAGKHRCLLLLIELTVDMAGVTSSEISPNRLKAELQTYLRSGVADLVAQVPDEETEALIERAFFQQPLAA